MRKNKEITEVIHMIEDKDTIEYNVTITVKDKQECANYDPFGLCYVDDCLHFPNARV